MHYYKITVQLGKNVQFVGTKRQSVSPEYVHTVIIYASDDSSCLTFEQAKDGAISYLKRAIQDLTTPQTVGSPELKTSKMKLERLENFKEKDILALYANGQNAVSL